MNFRSVELRHLLIAWLVLGVAFSIGSLYSFPSIFPLMFGVALLTLGLGFIGHELSHRVVARRLGCWAEFRLWAWGLIMALVLAVASGGMFIFAAPGAVYITPGLRHAWGSSIARRDNGYISLAGPAANIVVAMGFLLLAPAGGLLGFIGERGYQINLFLAGFNLLPFGMLDGQKVLSWNPLIWAAVAIPVWALWALTFLF